MMLVSFFPKNAGLWEKSVREPTEHSHLCSKHFEDSYFQPDDKLKLMGLWKRKSCLKDDAVPTVFEKPASLKRKVSLT